MNSWRGDLAWMEQEASLTADEKRLLQRAWHFEIQMYATATTATICLLLSLSAGVHFVTAATRSLLLAATFTLPLRGLVWLFFYSFEGNGAERDAD